MKYARFISPMILATSVLADYYIDNANTSVIYSMAPSQSGMAWQTFSVNTQYLDLELSNSTGNYTILLDASHCYDQNYALGVCGTGDNCFVEIPFTGSGIAMYVFSAGFSGMTASFAIDGGTPVSNSIDEPPPPSYQVSNVSLYDIQGLASGNHTMVMTMLDWNGSPTSMKFDYAFVNQSLVAAPVTTSTSSTSATSSSQTPTQTSVPAGYSSASNKINIGAVVGGTLGGMVVLTCVLIDCYFRRRQTRDTFKFPFVSEHHTNHSTPPSAPYTPFTHLEANSSIPLRRCSAILRGVLAPSAYPSPDEGIQSSQPIRYPQPSVGATSAPQTGPRYEFTVERTEVVERLRVGNIVPETVARVIEGLVASGLSADKQASEK